MAAGRRTQVQAIDELTEQLRVANTLQALALGPSAWEHDTSTRATTPTAVARLHQRNALRAEVRAALGIKEES
ncbi:hypothetical protein [Microbacterium luteum]|uniref:hypothetical protein n=1 Tax=Microbacterium luteum TaxID=2782167 RepID=UPI001886B72B|nr:hypothetical protein [Microbacterium luteum]